MRLDDHDLHDRFADLVDGTWIDLHHLADGAERDGRRLRRRHRLLSVAAAAAAVTVVAGGATALAGRSPVAPATPAPSASDGPPAREKPSVTTDDPGDLRTEDGPRVPLTGRATAAALHDLVGQLVDGRAVAFEGQETTAEPEEGLPATSYAALQWRVAGSDVATPVRINVQPGFRDAELSDAPRGYACDEGESVEAGTCEPVEGKEGSFFSCRGGRLRCSVTREDDLVVVSYEEHNGPAVDRIVDVYHPGTWLRVVVAATDAEEFETARKVVDEPALTLAELRRVAVLDVWGPTMPKAYDDAGSALRPYRDLSTNVS